MTCYNWLAPWYDRLTGDIPYGAFADFYRRAFDKDGGEFSLLLDLCCGTGTLTRMMAQRGYDMIGVDASLEMLMQAREKCADLPAPPLFLMQTAEELDLYGTVDAAICSLDGMNYIEPEALDEVFHRLRLFVRPGGLVIFDIKTPDCFKALDGEVFVDEREDVLCLWRADFDEEMNAIVYGMDIFSRRGRLWQRESEEHIEYAHSPAMLQGVMEKNGFTHICLHTDCPQGDRGRLFISAKRGND